MRASVDDTAPRKGLTLRLNHAAWRQLRQLALDDERPAHDLLIEALNDYFEKREKTRSA
jgi:predicted transcriptional regulator